MAEPDVTGGAGSERASTPITSSFKFNVPGLSQTTGEVRALNSSLTDLKSTLKELGTQNAQIMQGFNQMMSDLKNGAGSAQQMMQGTGSMGSGGAVSYSTTNAYGGGGIGGSATTAASSMGGGGGGGSFGDMIGRMIATPLKYVYERIEENRAVTQGMAQALSSVATLSGGNIEQIISGFNTKIPIGGNINDIMMATNIGAQTGYGDFSTPRSGAYFTALRQMQKLTPAIGAGQLANQYSSFLGNTQSQQRSLMMTGGAMSAFGAGGVPKTLAEWAESTLKFFEGQRPGKDRGKQFTKEQLQTQMFPGSNMDAWFSVNGVPDYMRQYFWQYVIGKAASGATGSGDEIINKIVEARGPDLAYKMLETATAASRRDFALATAKMPVVGKSLYQQYGTREDADQAFLEALRYTDVGLGVAGSTLGRLFSAVPTPIAAAMAQGAIDVTSGGVGAFADKMMGTGDPEAVDIGDYGPYGGTGMAGMDPGLASRVGAMMKANPRLKIVSGFRDGALQGRLHAAGVGMTAPAGKSSHGRGWAADLGPRSEYGWIVANAHKFGLSSANHVGEPWHVGLPGTVPMRARRRRGRGIGDVDIGDDSAMAAGASIGAAPAATPKLSGVAKEKGFLRSIFDVGEGALKSGQGFLSSLSGNLFGTNDEFGQLQRQVMASLIGGDLSPLFGKGGMLDTTNLMNNLLGGVFDLFGIPSVMNPFAETKNFNLNNLLGAFTSLLTKGPTLKPVLSSSLDFTAMEGALAATSAAGSAAAAGLSAAVGAVAGAKSPSSGVANILSKYGGGWTGSPASVAGNEQKILAALQAANRAGFSGDALVVAGALAGRESTWNPSLVNSNSGTGDKSYGLWQINMLGSLGPARRAEFGLSRDEDLLDPNVNASSAFKLSKQGTDFYHWGPYKNKPPLYAAQKWVQPVHDIAKSAGLIGDPFFEGGAEPMNVSTTYAPNVRNSSVSAPTVIENTFHINSNGTLADARRLTAFIADNLESEMTDRFSRRN